MWLKPIQIKCYAGFMADETPRRLFLEGQNIEVKEVLDCWYQVENRPEWPRATYFKVLGVNERVFLIKHDQEADQWFLCRVW